jgi:hypothetical protein
MHGPPAPSRWPVLASLVPAGFRYPQPGGLHNKLMAETYVGSLRRPLRGLRVGSGCGASPCWFNPSPLALTCWPGSPASTAARRWPHRPGRQPNNSLPLSRSSSIPTARNFPTSATKTVRPNCPTQERSLRRNKPCPRCQPSPWEARARFHARLGLPGGRNRSCRPRRGRVRDFVAGQSTRCRVGNIAPI